MILPIDEINRAVPYDKYFGIMKITDKQKRDRIAFARRLENALSDIFSLFATLSDYSMMDDYFIFRQLEQAYLDAVTSSNVPVDDYIKESAEKFATDFVETTRKHLTLKPGMNIPLLLGYIVITKVAGSNVHVAEFRDGERIGSAVLPYKDVLAATGDGWYISQDRAMYNAENEANTVLNYKDYKEAAQKYKYKTWHTENDSRVRMTHVPLEGERIPITDMFVVGESLMRFPKDLEYAADSPEEYVNCRCSVTYS